MMINSKRTVMPFVIAPLRLLNSDSLNEQIKHLIWEYIGEERQEPRIRALADVKIFEGKELRKEDDSGLLSQD